MKENNAAQKISVILLAGGVGARMQSVVPKQFMQLEGKPIALYSFELLQKVPNVSEIIVVCDPSYQHLFANTPCRIPVRFANPGKRRQDSVYNGLECVLNEDALVCVHDSARPLISIALVERVIQAADRYGAAAAGVAVKATIKISDSENMVSSTPDRRLLWEMQTPQAVRCRILKEGFQKAHESQATVTDDVSLAEIAGYPVKLVMGAYSNIKITTTEDLALAGHLLRSHV